MHPNQLTSAVLAALAARHPAVDPVLAIVLLLAAAAVYAGAYAISIRMHPWRPCRRCGESGKHRGTVFTRSFRSCPRCGGTGREPRRFARLP
jgi:hypothetical protein